MSEKVKISPPKAVDNLTPSELFRFFFQLGKWTEESFSAELQDYARGKSISTVTINKWKNKDVIPTRYTAAFLKLIEGVCAADIAVEWTTAFETVWAYHASRPKLIQYKSDKGGLSDHVCLAHGQWIQSLQSAPLMDEPFTANDVYVPLEMVETLEAANVLYDIEDLMRFATVGWEADPTQNWVHVSGDPGSGKSMTALHLASALVESQVFQIYIRIRQNSTFEITGSTLRHPITDVHSISAFIENFRSSSYTSACVILDGVDEVSHNRHDRTSALHVFISELEAQQDLCRHIGKTIRFVCFGRSGPLEPILKSRFPNQVRFLKLIGLSGGVELDDEPIKSLGSTDLRDVWWEQYTSAKGLGSEVSLPDFLCTNIDEFSEFGDSPLLTYLLCRTIWKLAPVTPSDLPFNEVVNRFTASQNRNSIFAALIEQVRRSLVWHPEASQNTVLSQIAFTSLLQHMALLNWKNCEETQISLKALQDAVRNSPAEKALEVLTYSASSLEGSYADGIAPIFFYRSGKIEDDAFVEFTIGSLPDYLLSTLILDKFANLMRAIQTQRNIKSAFQGWASLCENGVQRPRLADFCEAEVKLRYESFADLNWDVVLTLLKTNGLEDPYFQRPHLSPLKAIKDIQFSGSLLFLIWGCLNKERYRRSNTAFTFENSNSEFGPNDLKALQGPLGNDKALPPNFLGHSLSGVHIDSAIMNGLIIQTGHITHAVFVSTSFAMTYWKNYKVTESIFKACVFEHVKILKARIHSTLYRSCRFQLSSFENIDFSTSRFNQTNFYQCYFSDVDFSQVEMNDITFDRCIFFNVVFDEEPEATPSSKVRFHQCSFI